jgi:hypothetical protein
VPHPTPHHLADELKRDDGLLWSLIELLTRCDAPQLLHEVVRRLVELLEADEVALYAGHAPAVLIAADGGQAVSTQHGLVDRRMADALASRTTIALLPEDQDGAWRVGPQTYIRCGLWVPSSDEAMTPAILRVLRIRPEHFPAGTRRLLEIVAKRLAAVLHRIQQQRFDRARDTERTQLLLVSAGIAQELDFELVAERVVLGVTSVTDFANATVEVRRGHTLRRAAVIGNDDLADDVASDMALWRGALADENRVGELTYRVPLRNALPAEPTDEGTDIFSGLVTQLLDRQGDVLGFLTLSRPRTGAEATEQMVQSIELFARHAQIALANQSLYVEATRHRNIAQALALVTGVVSQSLDTHEILRTCCEAAQTYSVGERAAVYLVDQHGHVTLATAYGQDSDVPPSARGPLLVADDPLLTDALQSTEPVVVNDLTSSARYGTSWTSQELGLRSVAVCALRAADTTLGILLLDSHTAQVQFTRHEAELLSQIAGQAVVALRQAWLHAQTSEQAARTTQLLELTAAMTTAVDFEAIFERIVNAVRSRMDGPAISVLRIDERVIQVLGTTSGDRLRCPSPPQRLPLSAELREALQLVWEQGSLRVDDVRVYPTLTQIARPETRSVVMAAPLERAETDVLLTVSTTKVAAFTSTDERFLADLVRVIKLAVPRDQRGLWDGR